MDTHISTTHKLTVKETGNKAGKYHYQVIEMATGKVTGERKSNRAYLAASIDGCFFFGRLDLAANDAAKRRRTETDNRYVTGYYAILD